MSFCVIALSDLTGTIPSELGNMIALENLDLSKLGTTMIAKRIIFFGGHKNITEFKSAMN